MTFVQPVPDMTPGFQRYQLGDELARGGMVVLSNCR